MERNMMKLRFIGRDGSLGLRHRKIYNVNITSDKGFIVVHWNGGLCPYSAPQSFAKNWKEVI